MSVSSIAAVPAGIVAPSAGVGSRRLTRRSRPSAFACASPLHVAPAPGCGGIPRRTAVAAADGERPRAVGDFAYGLGVGHDLCKRLHLVGQHPELAAVGAADGPRHRAPVHLVFVAVHETDMSPRPKPSSFSVASPALAPRSTSPSALNCGRVPRPGRVVVATRRIDSRPASRARSSDRLRPAVPSRRSGLPALSSPAAARREQRRDEQRRESGDRAGHGDAVDRSLRGPAEVGVSKPSRRARSIRRPCDQPTAPRRPNPDRPPRSSNDTPDEMQSMPAHRRGATAHHREAGAREISARMWACAPSTSTSTAPCWDPAARCCATPTRSSPCRASARCRPATARAPRSCSCPAAARGRWARTRACSRSPPTSSRPAPASCSTARRSG